MNGMKGIVSRRVSDNTIVDVRDRWIRIIRDLYCLESPWNHVCLYVALHTIL